MATYVDGEAPETDSEDEQYLFNLSYMKIGNNSLESPNVALNNAKEILFKGNVVEGLSETQDLIDTPVATELTEDFTVCPSDYPPPPAEFFYENELLHKKINDVSTTMLNSFIQTTIAPISKQLIETDSSLINTQLTLQTISTSAKEVSERSKKINAKCKNLVDSNFLTTIKKVTE
ncbi:CLUMA_CG011352, isoform A [Clunio marinus]|uniref:CLUMA_CG011352, isoform A n=1 Tax=Clunio marinus TaxID=568069 RepID=A0A1J1IEJ9_9DIPT|nr:CLUMA_CG011352, isoform A [Clunio marinus]